MSGVGSLIRTRNGVTALLADLAQWESNVPAQGVGIDRDVERETFLRLLKVRDPELESACKVGYFVSPQPIAGEPNRFRDWILPTVRFPLAGICANPNCRKISWSNPDAAGQMRCDHCATPKGKFLRRNRVLQLSVFKVCANGHIGEIDFAKETHSDCKHDCFGSNLIEVFSANPKKPKSKCLDCGCISDPNKYEDVCTGERPWVIDGLAEVCNEQMRLVERTSVKTYFPQVKSAIYMPTESDLSEKLLLWLLNRGNIEEIDVDSEHNMTALENAAKNVNLAFPRNELRRHVLHLQQPYSEDEVWDPLTARTKELDVLTAGESSDTFLVSSLLEREQVPLDGLDKNLLGENGFFTKVVAISKLTETRVQDGFSRIEPPEDLSRQAGQKLMWGFESDKHRWLPGIRCYGEGILLVLNMAKISAWSSAFMNQNHAGPNPEAPTQNLVHTLAHLLMGQAALECGYPAAGIRDRIYVLSDGRIAFLIYVAEADSAGTLGGLVELAYGKRLENLVRNSLNSAKWCAQDPVCISETTFQVEHQIGACHQCVLLPETSCELFNRSLDRGTLIGDIKRNMPGYLDF
jgi:hypothetical protein